MADPRFFRRTGPHTLAQLATVTGAEILRGSPDLLIDDIGALDQAGSTEISFLDNVKYRQAFRTSTAGACIIAAEMAAVPRCTDTGRAMAAL